MIDRYTRCILTVIAGALVTLVIQDAVRTSAAQSSLQRVQICDERTCATLRPFTFAYGNQSVTLDVLPVLSMR